MASRIIISQQVYESLRTDILHQALKPGTPLVEEELAEKFQTSRTPIREALKRLESDGLISVYPYKGCFVRTLTRQDIDELYEIRIALECMCCRTIVEKGKVTDAMIDAMETKLAEAEQAFQAEDFEAARLYGDYVHNAIIEVMGNKRIADTLSQLRTQRSYMSLLASKEHRITHQSIMEHVSIKDALKLRNARLAEELMRVHLESGWHRVIQELDSYFED